MRRTWLRSLFRSWGVRAHRQPAVRRLGMEFLEDRALPSTMVSFQQGTNSYAGTTEVRIDNSNPNTATNGTSTGFYFLDGSPRHFFLGYYDPATHLVRKVADLPGLFTVWGAHLAPDGHAILFSGIEHSEGDLVLVEGFQ